MASLSGYKIVADAAGLVGTTSSTIVVNGPGSVAFVSFTITGESIASTSLAFTTSQTFTIVAQVKDLNGNAWTATDGYLSLGFKTGFFPAGAKISGVSRVMSSGGVVTFKSIGLPVPGSSK